MCRTVGLGESKGVLGDPNMLMLEEVSVSAMVAEVHGRLSTCVIQIAKLN